MTSSLINLVIDKFLSNFIEIDKSQTYASLLSGVLELRNVKIKKECFGYINLPYFILDIGYIGKIKIEMSMPFFYNYPIDIYINEIFIYAKQKDINELKEKDEITSMKDFKNRRLETEENIHNKLEEIENTSPSLINQIINNINIHIKNIVIRFEDNISNPISPFAFGIILKEIKINSLKENNNADFCYKLISFNDFNIFWDCSNSFEELKYDKFMDDSLKDLVSVEMTNYLKDSFNFYVYCQTELSKDLKHEYILYKLDMDIKVSMNYNLDNNNPKYELHSNDIELFLVKFNLTQISNFFLLLSYYNLFYYYQLGLSRKIFNKHPNEKEKEKYILEYLKYYYSKYKEKNEENAIHLKKIEENMNYEDIKKLRKIALNHIYQLYIEEKEIETKLKNENSKWFFSVDKQLINDLGEKLTNIKNQIDEQIKFILLDKYHLFSEKETNIDIYSNLPDDFIFYRAKLNIKKLELKICDFDDDNKIKDLLDFSLDNMIISYIAQKYNTSYSLIIKNLILSQNIVPNEEYDKIIIAKSKKEEDFILIEYQTNKDEFGNYVNKIIFKSGIQIVFFANMYQIQYINYNILSCLYAFISFVEIPRYTDENNNDIVQLGYVINENNRLTLKKKQQENYTVKYEYDINLQNPVIIIPQNILDKQNKKCIIVFSEELIIKSNLSKETPYKNSKTIKSQQENNNNDETNSNYESCLNDSSIIDNIYDKHYLNIYGIKVCLSNYCVKEDNYMSSENVIIDNFNLSILYKTLIDLNDKNDNNNYNLSSFVIDIKELDVSIDEFQIIFLLTYLRVSNSQKEYLIENKIINVNDEIMNQFIENLELKEVILKDEFALLNKKEVVNKKEIKSEIDIKEEDFYKIPNTFFMEIKINKIRFIIQKIYPDLSKVNFLQLELNNLIYSQFSSIYGDSLMKIYLKDILLLNTERDIKKNLILPREFQVLMKNNKENINCMIYSSLYIKTKNEYITNIEMNNLNVLTSFDTLARMYVFSMHYYGRYLDIQYVEKKDKNRKKNLNIRKSVIQLERDSRNSQKEVMMKQYKISNENVFKFKLVNSNFRIPSDETNLNKPVFSTKLNIFYDQSSNSETEHIYNINTKTLLKGKLLYDNKSMNIMIYESDFDIIYFNQKGIRNDKILSNYRIQYRSKYAYLLSKKNSISNMNIIVEPLILNVNLYQLKYLINLYYDLMKFLYESLYSNYVPFIKYEYVFFVQGKPIQMKKRNTIKKIITHVMELNKLKNKMIKLTKKKKIANLTNSFNSINFQLDKIYVTILDDNYYGNNKKEKRVLLALEMSKIFFNSINNSHPKDKTNISNDLLGIITNSKLSIDKYIIHNLYRYMNFTFTLELYYYNLEYSDFEPIIEPVNMQYLSFQTDPIFRAKTFLNIENIININVSTNSMKILNIFMSKYSNESPNGLDGYNIEEINTISKKNSEDFLRMISNENLRYEEQEETVIKLTNKTGVFIYFWFDFDKENKMKIKNNETIHLTNKQIYKTRKKRKLIQKKKQKKTLFLLEY